MSPTGKYRIIAFKDFVPHPLRFLTLLCTVLIFQLSASVYIPDIGAMSGATSLTEEDLKLLSSVSMIGLSVIFPVLFRLKFHFTSKTILTTCSFVILVCSIVLISTMNMPILIVASFFLGMFRMIATFECMSSMQLVVTPKRDMKVFFCFVYTIVLGTMQLQWVIASHLEHAFDWRHIYLFIIAAHAALILVLSVLMRHIHFVKPIPLYRIDWLSMLIWSAGLTGLNIIFYFGHRLDWLHSHTIVVALVTSAVLLLYFVLRKFLVDRPYIPVDIYKYKGYLVPVALFFLMVVLLGIDDTTLPVYTQLFLGYDALHNATLYWVSFIGILAGVACCFVWIPIVRGPYKTIFLVGFVCILLSHFVYYCTIVPSAPMRSLFPIYFLRYMGQGILYISVTTYLMENVPFLTFFQSIAVVSCVRTAVGVPFAEALFRAYLDHACKMHRVNVSTVLDGSNPMLGGFVQSSVNAGTAGGLPVSDALTATVGGLYSRVDMNAMLLAWKETLVWVILLGIASLCVLLLHHFAQPHITHMPTFSSMAARIRKKMPGDVVASASADGSSIS